MPRADQRLYAAFLRLGRAFEADGLPLLGIAGGGPVCHSLAWRRCLRAAMEVPRPGDGFAGELSVSCVRGWKEFIRPLGPPTVTCACRAVCCQLLPPVTSVPVQFRCPCHARCTVVRSSHAAAPMPLASQPDGRAFLSRHLPYRGSQDAGAAAPPAGHAAPGRGADSRGGCRRCRIPRQRRQHAVRSCLLPCSSTLPMAACMPARACPPGLPR